VDGRLPPGAVVAAYISRLDVIGIVLYTGDMRLALIEARRSWRKRAIGLG
jgi:hypothetical protein